MLRANAGPETLPPPSAGADEIRSGAEDILGRPEFQRAPKSLYQRALEEVVGRVGDFLDLVVSGGRGALVAWIVLALMVTAIAFLVARGLQWDRRRLATAAQAGGGREVRRPAADWAAEAAKHEAAGAWREALRCRYRWMIATLAGAGIVEEVPGTTSGEYRVLVSGSVPAAAQSMAGATELFERAWYGNEPIGPEEAATFSDLAGRILSGSSRNGAGGAG